MAEIQFVRYADRSFYETYYDHVREYAPNNIYLQEEFQKDFGVGEHSYKWLIIEEINGIEPKFVCAKRVYSEEQMKALARFCTCRGCLQPKSWWSWWAKPNQKDFDGCLKKGWHGTNPKYIRVAELKLRIQ